MSLDPPGLPALTYRPQLVHYCMYKIMYCHHLSIVMTTTCSTTVPGCKSEVATAYRPFSGDDTILKHFAAAS